MNKQENPPVVAVPGSIHVEAATLTCARFVALWLAGRGLDPAKALRAVLGLVPELRHAAGAGGFLAVALRRDGLEVSGDSIMGLLMLAAAQGSVITVETEGPEAAPLMAALAALVGDMFGEDG